MPGVIVKSLYLGKNVGDLNKLAGEFPKVENPRLFVKSAEKLYKTAEENALLGDEEKSYVLYMKFFNIVSAIKKTAEYKKNEQYYKDMIGMKKCLAAIDEAEKLSHRLKERYEEKEAQDVSAKLQASEKKKILEASVKERAEEARRKEEEEQEAVLESARNVGSQGSVSSSQLYSMLQDANTSVLVMDARSEEDFSASHINHRSCINVPAESVPPGCTVGQVEKRLAATWKEAWNARGTVDFIVLMDWRSTLQQLTPGTTLKSLKDALFKWDQEIILRSEPLVLDGGYDDWLLFYPTVTTNANIPRPPSTPAFASTTPSLDTIDYDMDSDILKTEEQLLAERQVKIAKFKREAAEKAQWEEEQRDKAALLAKNTTVTDKDNSKNVKPLNIPSVDRSKKPTAANNLNNMPSASPDVKPSNLGSTKMNNLLYDANTDRTSACGKQEKNTNITKQGHVDIPVQVPPKELNVQDVPAVIPSVNRSLKPQDITPPSSAESDGQLTAQVSTNKPENTDVSFKPPRSTEPPTSTGPPTSTEPPRSTTGSAGNNLSSPKKGNQAIVLEYQARVAKLQKVREETDQLLAVKKQEAHETANLMRQKKQVEQDLRQLEQELAKRSRTAGGQGAGLNVQVSSTSPDRTSDEPERVSFADLEKARQQEEAEKLSRQTEAQTKKERDEEKSRQAREEADKRREAERLEHEKQAKKNAELLAKEKENKDEMERIEREEQERRERVMREREEEEKMRKMREAAAREEDERRAAQMREAEAAAKFKQQEERRLQDQRTIAATPAKVDRPQGTHHTPGLPVGWEKRLDATSGRYYYINHRDKHTQWNPPTPVAAPKKVVEDTGGVYKTRLKDEGEQSSGGLKRSHSTPNIAKLMAEEEAAAQPMPQVSRVSKPMPNNRDRVAMTINTDLPYAKLRNLNPVAGNVGQGLCGLRNIGNTCYLNSTIQCLSNTVPLSIYFLADNYIHDINKENVFGKGGLIAEEYAVVIKGLWSGQNRSIAPRDLWSLLGRFYTLFASHEHQDSQELLLFLLDGLHEDLNQVKKRPQLPEQKNDGVHDSVAAQSAWEMHKKINRSIVVELFQGQFKSTVQCLACGKKSVTFDVFVNLSLPLPQSSRCTLADCLGMFSKDEKMSGESRWDCPRCKRKQDAVKNIVLWKLPPVLVIQLKRFYYKGTTRDKITSHVDFPVDELDMNRYTASNKPTGAYHLYGVSNHYGSLDGGHYTASVKNPNNKRWYKYDDSEVSEMSKPDIKSSAAFILFYSNMEMQTLLK